MQESAYALRSIQGLGASSDMMRSAIKKMDATRDAHWLTKHPVDYA